jgi:hypothetical protein
MLFKIYNGELFIGKNLLQIYVNLLFSVDLDDTIYRKGENLIYCILVWN